MRFVLTEDQLTFREVARAFLQRELPLEGRVELAGAAPDRSAWNRMVEELGVHTFLAPEAQGGLGGSYLDLGMVVAEAGRALADIPLLSSAAVATDLVLRAGDRSPEGGGAELLQSMVGEAEVAVVVPAREDLLRAERGEDGGWRVSGLCRSVLDLPWADHILVFASTPAGSALFAVDGDDVVLCPAMDVTRRYGDLDLRDREATWLANDPSGSLAGFATATMRTGLALDAAGGARRCLELAVEYAGQREQFGKPIGSFQAIKHKCADMLLGVEAATSAAEAAAWQLSQPGASAGEVSRTATLAKAFAADAYVRASGELIQILGGIGFTWEHPAHLFFKRAKTSALLAGTPQELRFEQLERIGLLSTH
jgi:alkylation response protein AidB-like acyl-CoA dehydrogenase